MTATTAAVRPASDFHIDYQHETLTYPTLQTIGFDEIKERRDDEMSDWRQASWQSGLFYLSAGLRGLTAVFKYFGTIEGPMEQVFWHETAPALAIIGMLVGCKRGSVAHEAAENALELDKACVMLKDETAAVFKKTVIDLEEQHFLPHGSHIQHHRMS